MYICLTEPLRCIAELTQQCKSTVFQFLRRRNIYKRYTVQSEVVNGKISVANFRALEQPKMLFKRELF